MRALLALLLLLAPSTALAQPRVMIWAWHGAHDLRGLPSSIGVAYLARAIRVDTEGAIVVRARHEPVLLDEATVRWAVVRIELDHGADASDLDRASDAILAQLAIAAREPLVSGLQIDFDAPRSVQATYAALLARERGTLASGRRLSMTALGSWCTSDRWLAAAPVDVVVPMMFGVGHDTELVHAVLARDRTLPEPRCRDALGVREGDPLPGPTTFVFGQGPWTLARVRAATTSLGLFVD